jgi:hypothetical protein
MSESAIKLVENSAKPDVLPDSRPRRTRSVKRVVNWFGLILNWIPIYCANCGKDGGLVPERNCTFAFYLCQSCADKLGPIVGTYMVPDEVWWAKVKQVQFESYGRELTPKELALELDKIDSPMSKLARDPLNPYKE